MSVGRSSATGISVSESDLLLLRAALLAKEHAAQAAQTWLTTYRTAAGPDFHLLNSGSRRLLPLVYRNVQDLLPPARRNELRKIHLEYWSQNQQLFRRLENFLKWFESLGIPVLVLKGAALSVLHYCDHAVRPMSDYDVLIPEQIALEVIQRLQREGWGSTYFSSRAPRYRSFLKHSHAIPLSHPEHGSVDLHWHVLCEATFPGADSSFWAGSVPLQIKTAATRALNPTDQLIHACVHGYMADVVAPIRWIADAVTVLHTSQIDWKRLTGLANELRVTIPVREGLAFLQETFSAKIPEVVVEELASFPVRSSERSYFERLAKPERRWQEIFADNWERHRRANRDVPGLLRLATLPRQLQMHYNLLDLGELKTFTQALLRRRIDRMLKPT